MSVSFLRSGNVSIPSRLPSTFTSSLHVYVHSCLPCLRFDVVPSDRTVGSKCVAAIANAHEHAAPKHVSNAIATSRDRYPPQPPETDTGMLGIGVKEKTPDAKEAEAMVAVDVAGVRLTAT